MCGSHRSRARSNQQAGGNPVVSTIGHHGIHQISSR